VEHSLQSRGGGFRQRLVAALGEAFGMEEGRAGEMAGGLEFFHLASLILDDLPCMDDAGTRRGLPCTHRLYGESMAILSALALINRAYFQVWDALRGTLPSIQAEVNALLDECLGLNGVLNGQALDLNFAASDRAPATVERIARQKTGSLLRLSMLLPALASGQHPRVTQQLRRLADTWGAVYQLLDDLKDLEWSEAESGKTGMRDLALDRPNLALAMGKERAVARLRNRLAEGRRLLGGLAGRDALVAALEPFQQQLEQAGAACLSACAA
jgi:geranylgeranyl pyrophosphate synthase